tara:strand:+ start:4570 stop:5103 length:534 start_codon:yes stop_codon:yes gene_type:complete
MESNFDKAVRKAFEEIKYLTDIGAMKYMESFTRSALIGVAKENFDWEKELKNVNKDYEAFDKLRRYCSMLIRKNSSIPSALKEWLTSYLDEVYIPPTRNRGAPKKGSEINIHLPKLVQRIAREFNLNPSRNDASEPNSACDAVSLAINQLPAKERLKISSYDALAKSYFKAKKNKHL